MNLHNFKKRRPDGIQYALLGLVVVGAGLAHGQGAGRLEEVVVTAQKREQSLNELGLTVTALSGDALRARGISSLADLAISVPGLSYTVSANNTPVYTLRGVGFYETSLSAYPTVSIYLDEVPLSFPAMSTQVAFDLERVEVLKGPQGTLFGQNATGGAINYIAAKPTESFEAGAELSYGRFDTVTAEGFVSGPLTDTIRGRLAARAEYGDGWQTSNTRPGDTVGDVRRDSARLLLDIAPRDNLSVRLNLNGWRNRSDTQAPQHVAIAPQLPSVDADVANAPFSPREPRAADWTPGIPRADNHFWQASVRVDWALNDALNLTSLTAYNRFLQRQGDEGDGLPAQTLDLSDNQGRIRSFNQELRLANNGEGGVLWVAGLNYEKSDVDQLIVNQFEDSSTHETLAQIGYPMDTVHYSSDQKLENYAAFANAEWTIAAFTLKGGVRYTDARRDATICEFDPGGAPGGTGEFFHDVILGGAFGPHVPGTCFAVNTLGAPQNGVAPGAPGRYEEDLNEDNVSWRVGLDWAPDAGLLFYGNIAKGYKAGSFPTVAGSTFEQYVPVSQESVLAYEVGFKATFLDRALQLNGATFYYDYEDKQIRAKVIDPVFGILDVLQNIPKSTVKGAELELTAWLFEGFTVSAAYTYLDATIDEFSGINGAGVASDFGGTDVPYTPRHQASVNIDYELPLSDRWTGFAGLSANYRSDAVAVIGGDINPPPPATPQSFKMMGIDSYTLVDLRLGVRSADERWRVQLWGKNITDEYYWNNAVAAYDTVVRYAGMPATYGVTVGYRY